MARTSGPDTAEVNTSGANGRPPAQTRVKGDRRSDRLALDRRHHHDPDTKEPAERPQCGPGPIVHALHACGGPPPAKHRRGRRGAGPARPECGLPRTPGATLRRRPRPRSPCHSPGQADHAKSDFDKPLLPSYFDPEGANPSIVSPRPSSDPRSRPDGTSRGEPHRRTGSHAERNDYPRPRSRSRRRCARCGAARRPRRGSLPGRPASRRSAGASAAMGPPIWPLKTCTSFSDCSSVACSSTKTPTRQLPSVMTLGNSIMTATLHPARSVRTTAPCRRLETKVARQKKTEHSRDRRTDCTGTRVQTLRESRDSHRSEDPGHRTP